MSNLYGILRKHFWLILIVVGLFYAYNAGLLTIFAGEKELQWKGLLWAYKASQGSTVSATSEAVTLTASSSTESDAYVRNDFDLSKFSEVKLLVDASTSASIRGNSASGSANAGVYLDNIAVAVAVSSAEERGGTNIPSDSDTTRASATLKRSGNSWTVLVNDVPVATVQNANPQLKFQVHAGGNNGAGNANLVVRATFVNAALSVAPINLPAVPSLSSLISGITAWLKKILDAVPFLTIVGSQSPALGTTQTYTTTLQAQTPTDDQYSDGTYAVRYCNTALVKADGTIISETGFEKCENTYSKSFTAKIPNNPGQYAVVAVMAESKGTFTTATSYGTEVGQWTFTPYEVITKDALDITSKAPIPGASEVPLKPSGNFLTSLFQKLFGWLPFFK